MLLSTENLHDNFLRQTLNTAIPRWNPFHHSVSRPIFCSRSCLSPGIFPLYALRQFCVLATLSSKVHSSKSEQARWTNFMRVRRKSKQGKIFYSVSTQKTLKHNCQLLFNVHHSSMWCWYLHFHRRPQMIFFNMPVMNWNWSGHRLRLCEEIVRCSFLHQSTSTHERLCFLLVLLTLHASCSKYTLLIPVIMLHKAICYLNLWMLSILKAVV